MELRELEVFLILADELHFGRTAQRLQLTQGRVSQIIRALEREIGGMLFDRSSRRVCLTPLGEHLRAGSKQAHEELIETLHSCRDMTRGVRDILRIGYLPSIGRDFVGRLVQQMRKNHPECEVVFRATSVRFFNLPESPLRDECLDAVLLWCPGGNGDALRGPGVAVGPALEHESRGVVVPHGHPLARRSAVDSEDLVPYPMLDPGHAMNPAMRDLWTPRFTTSGRQLTVTANDLQTLLGTENILLDDVLTLVLTGRGLWCTILSALDRFPCPGLSIVPVHDLPPMVIVPVWLTSRDDAAIRAFVAACSLARSRSQI